MSKQQLMQLFIDQNYISLPILAKQCAVSELDILALENAQCIPRHTYELRRISIFTCAGIDAALTENTAIDTTIYYHASIFNWAKSALLSLKTISLATLAAKIKDSFATELEKKLNGVRTPGCQSFDQAWSYWIDGTWGKCLKTISVDCLAKKELARKCIAEIMQYSPKEINLQQKDELANAIKNYISASLDFDSYGMRHLLAEEAIEKFQLNIEIDKKYLK